MPLKKCYWVPIAAAQFLAKRWKVQGQHEAAHQVVCDAFRDALGWGENGRAGLASLAPFKRSKDMFSFWEDYLKGPKRDQVENKLVPEYCRREGIFLDAGETLLQHFGRCKGQEMVTVQADQV